MTISSSTTTNHSAAKSLVIQAYLNGKSRDQISKETRISTGKISNIISDWKTGIKMPYVEELREFAVTVKKSGMSIAQCARGYRIAQLMDNLGISDDVDYYNDEDEYKSIEKNYSSDSSSIINYGNKKAIDFLIFVQDIYINCLQLKIHPSHIFSWIKDLLDYDISKCLLLSNDDDNDDDTNSSSLVKQLKQKSQKEEDDYSLKEATMDDEIKIPFTSQLSFHINQKKNQCIKLENYKKNLKEDIKKISDTEK